MLLAVFLLAAIGAAVSTTLLMLSVSSAQTSGTLQESLEARGLANTCAELGLQHMVGHTTYIGNGSLTLGQGSCTYTVAQLDASRDAVTGTGVVGGTTRKVEVIIVAAALSVTTWQEVPTF